MKACMFYALAGRSGQQFFDPTAAGYGDALEFAAEASSDGVVGVECAMPGAAMRAMYVDLARCSKGKCRVIADGKGLSGILRRKRSRSRRRSRR